MRILGLLILGTVFFAACTGNSEKNYTLSVKETLDVVKSKTDILSAEQVANILLSKDENEKAKYLFVDIRTPYEYNVWHVDGAVNIPAKDIFSEEYQEVFDNPVTKVLYCSGSHQAMDTYLELLQLGYKNIKVSLGGYAFIKEHIIDTLDIANGVYNQDSALYDYAKVVQETAGAGSAAPEESSAKPKKPMIKRQKKEVSGGCG